MINKNHLESEIKESIRLYNQGHFKKASELTDMLCNKYPNNFIVLNIHGVNNIALGKWNDAEKCFKKAASINPKFPEAQNNLGLAKLNLGKIAESLVFFIKALELRPNYERAQYNIIRVLTYHKPKNHNSNILLKTDELIKNVSFNFDQNKLITDENVVDFFNESNKILSNNLKKIHTIETQIYRRKNIDLNCKRHFMVFNQFQVIPEYCFHCYKVIFEPKNILELFKLYFVFDNLKLKNENSRKCTIELRPNITGCYKAFIFCSSVDEAKKIKNEVEQILNTTIGNNLSIAVKRGCSQFAELYPDYKKVEDNEEKMMQYNIDWKDKEKIIDDKIKDNFSTSSALYKTLKGASLSDILIMRNWLFFAKKIGDNFYKKFNNKIEFHPELEKILSKQLTKRNQEFVSN